MLLAMTLALSCVTIPPAQSGENNPFAVFHDEGIESANSPAAYTDIADANTPAEAEEGIFGIFIELATTEAEMPGEFFWAEASPEAEMADEFYVAEALPFEPPVLPENAAVLLEAAVLPEETATLTNGVVALSEEIEALLSEIAATEEMADEFYVAEALPFEPPVLPENVVALLGAAVLPEEIAALSNGVVTLSEEIEALLGGMAATEEIAVLPDEMADESYAAEDLLSEPPVPLEDVAALLEEATALLERIAALLEEATALPEEAAILPDEMAVLPDEMAALADEVAALSEEIEALSGEIAALEEIAVLPDEIAILPDEMAALADEVAALSEEIEALSGEIAALEEIAVLPDEMAVLSDEMVALADEVAALSEEIAALRDEIAALRGEGVPQAAPLAAMPPLPFEPEPPVPQIIPVPEPEPQIALQPVPQVIPLEETAEPPLQALPPDPQPVPQPPPNVQPPAIVQPPTPRAIPEVPFPSRGVTGRGDEIVFSRIVHAAVGQTVEIPFRGSGWIYLGEMNLRRGISFNSRRADPEGQSFIFGIDAPGEYILRFYRHDFIRDFILNDHVQIIATEALEIPDAGWVGRVDRGRVVAEPRWPEAIDEALAFRGQPPAVTPPPVITPPAVPPPVVPPSAVIPPPPPAAQLPAPPPALAQVPPAMPPPLPPIETQPDNDILEIVDYIARAREEFTVGRIDVAISYLNRFRERFPSGSDEAWWLFAQCFGANSPSRNMLAALDFYRRLVRDFPQSSRAADARRRITYIERRFINIR